MTKENRKLVASIVAAAVLTGTAVYEGKNAVKNIVVDKSLKNVVETFESDTKLDEAVQNNLATYKNMSIIEAADTLEESIRITDMLKNYDFSDVKNLDKLTKEEYDYANTLKEEDVALLIQIMDSNKDSLEFEETKIKSIKMLDYIKTKKEKYIKENGDTIVLSALSWTIKSSIAEEFVLPSKNIKDIEIPKINKVQDMNFYVLYNNKKFYISNNSNIFSALYYYYLIKTNNDLQGQENKIYKEALDSAKSLTMTGTSIKDNKLTNVRTLKEAKKELKMQ